MANTDNILNRIPRAIIITQDLNEDLPKDIEALPQGFPVIRLLDQTLLPSIESYMPITDHEELIDAIKILAVRGAPALGVAGACGVALIAAELLLKNGMYGEVNEEFVNELGIIAKEVADARPTAVNLEWGVNKALDHAYSIYSEFTNSRSFVDEMVEYANSIIHQDEECNRLIGKHGTALLPENARVLTHCNAGSLATAFFGTALGVIYTACQEGKIDRVFADETRPLNQGARLTAWELAKAGVPVTLICDDMAAFTISSQNIDAVIVGADRISQNGDTANKIGTLGLAILAQHFGIPFYVAAPTSTLDMSCSSGSSIPIEERPSDEVLQTPIEGVDVLNPAFDVTPSRLITKIITEDGTFSPDEIAARYSA